MKRKSLSVLIAVVFGLSLMPVVPVSAADLTDVSAISDNYTAGATANYTIDFRTATTGNITTIDMAFATEFDVSGVTLGTFSGIGPGSISASGDNVTYTVSSAENVTENTLVSIGLSGIVNPTASGSYSITITTKDHLGAAIDSGIASVTIDPGPIEHFFVVTEHAGTEVASTAFSVNVTAQDLNDNTATSYNGTEVSIAFTSTATSAPDTTPPTIPTSQSLDFSVTPGIATATGFILVDAGETPTITATEGAISGTSAAITVNPSDAASLGVTGITDPIIRGTASDVTVTAYDGYGNVATGYTGTIDFTSTDTAATLLPSSYTFVPAIDNGTHTFIDGVTFNTVGEQSVTATDSVIGTITGAQSEISVYVEAKLLRGGGGGAPRPGVTPVRGVMSSQGKFYEDVTCESEDECVELFIPEDTIGKGPNGAPLYTIRIFEAEDPPSAPENTCCIGLVYDIGPSGATFDPPIGLTIKYDEAMIPEGVNEEDLVIVFRDEEAGEWDDLVCTVDVENDTTTACVSHFTSFAIIARAAPPPPPPAPAPAAFSLSNLYVQPTEVQPKEAVTITLSVANTGGTEDSYSVVLKINGVKEAEARVTVAVGSTRDVSFSVTKEEAGSYSVTVDGLSGSFTVVAPPAPAPKSAPAPPAKPAVNWPVIGGAVVIVGVLIYFLVIRRRA